MTDPNHLRVWRTQFSEAVAKSDNNWALQLWKEFAIHCLDPRYKKHTAGVMAAVAKSNDAPLFDLMISSPVMGEEHHGVVQAFCLLCKRADDTSAFYPSLRHLTEPKFRATVLKTAAEGGHAGWVGELIKTPCDITRALISSCMYSKFDCMDILIDALKNERVSIKALDGVRFALRALPGLEAKDDEQSKKHLDQRVHVIKQLTPFLTNWEVDDLLRSGFTYGRPLGSRTLLSSLTDEQWDSVLINNREMVHSEDYAQHQACVLREAIKDIPENLDQVGVKPRKM